MISRLSRSALLRRIVRVLQLHRVANAWLRRFPLVRRLPGSGVIYRAVRLESIPLARDMFGGAHLYNASLLSKDFSTFVDLGCNVGYFTCWLAHLARGRRLKGLMIDANPETVAEAQWHAQANGWTEVFAVQGLVGEGRPGDFAEFYLYESNICSMSQVPDAAKTGLQGRWERIRVPCVSVEQLWRERFGETRCHLLKVDVEGSELAFLKAEQSFLALVDGLLVEWHKWRVSLDELREFLQTHGFDYVRTLDETDQMGTAFFRRAI